MNEDEVARIKHVYAERNTLSNREYNLLFSASTHLGRYTLDLKICSFLRKHFPEGVEHIKALDVGCGIGNLLQFLNNIGAQPSNLYGIDLSEYRIQVAKNRNLEMNFEVGTGCLPYEAESFDLITAMTVFTSVLSNKMRAELAYEMSNLLKKDGCILIYDFKYNNPNNADVRALSYKDVKKLFPNSSIKRRSVTLAPPIARRIAGKSIFCALLLEKFIPFLRTHNLYFITRAN